MKYTLGQKFVGHVGGWYPFPVMPVPDEEYTEWIKPVGQLVKRKRWPIGRPGKGPNRAAQAYG